MSMTTTAPVDHPGTFLVEELAARNWQQVDLAYILGMSPQQLSPLLTGKARITPDLAVALGDAFDMPAEFFANLQKLHDLSKAKPVDPGVKTRASWLSVFPVRDMINRGWIEDAEPSLLHLQMLRFLDKNRVEDLPFIGNGKLIPHAAKKTAYEASYDETTPIQYVWLHRVRKLAEVIEDCPKFSAEKLIATLPKIRSHMLDKSDLIEIPKMLHECGVRFVLVEALPGSKIDGVCVWIDGNPVIGMSTRLNRMDNFCFVLRHECEHVIRGHGRDAKFSPIDEFDYDPDSDVALPTEEMEANAAAREFLVPKKMLDSFMARKGEFISEKDVLAFSARLEINAAVIVGQIQRRSKKYGWLRKYQDGIRDYLLEWPFKDGWGHIAPTGL